MKINKNEVKQILKMKNPTNQDIQVIGEWLVDNRNDNLSIDVLIWYFKNKQEQEKENK